MKGVNMLIFKDNGSGTVHSATTGNYASKIRFMS